MPLRIRTTAGLPSSLRAVRAIHRCSSFALADEREATVRQIIDDVRRRGDRAVVELERKFSCASMTAAKLRVRDDEFAAAQRVVGAKFVSAARRIAANVRDYHRHQRHQSWSVTKDGVTLGQQFSAIENVGCYVPAGKAPLPSTLIMTAVPAQVAGVKRIIVCTPALTPGPSPRGRGEPCADQHVLAVAAVLGLGEVFKVGGAQAIAAMAFGTKTIPAVDKIVGPGSVYTVLAKKLLFGVVGIESLPGPSEVAVIADDSANPDWIAADLLAQAEHGPDSVCALFTNSQRLANTVHSSLATRLSSLGRSAYAAQSLQDFGLIACVDSLDDCCDLANAMAPEHLQIMTKRPRALLAKIRHAGAIFLGHHSPVPLGDYVAGPSHVLPTAGTARFSSGLGVDDFIKKSSVVEYSARATKRALADLEVFAQAEGLDAHAAAVRIRIEDRG